MVVIVLRNHDSTVAPGDTAARVSRRISNRPERCIAAIGERSRLVGALEPKRIGRTRSFRGCRSSGASPPPADQQGHFARGQAASSLDPNPVQKHAQPVAASSLRKARIGDRRNFGHVVAPHARRRMTTLRPASTRLSARLLESLTTERSLAIALSLRRQARRFLQGSIIRSPLDTHCASAMVRGDSRSGVCSISHGRVRRRWTLASARREIPRLSVEQDDASPRRKRGPTMTRYSPVVRSRHRGKAAPGKKLGTSDMQAFMLRIL